MIDKARDGDRAVRRLAASAGVAMALALLGLPAGMASARVHRVLRVGTWHGVRGQFHSIQGAVDAARRGDWILVGPGDYHERGDYRHRPARDVAGGAVWISGPAKRGLHLRGMDRNRVMVDGTRRGARECSARRADQDLGARGPGGRPLGRNGVEVYKAEGVSVENLSSCNYINGAGGGGNEIWFNGGDGSGRIGMGRWLGRYLSGTSSYYQPGRPSASYALFVSNARGPGLLDWTYGSNMNDASYYIGACPDCNAVVDHAHAQYSALGYSGTNSGGRLVLERSEWDHNKTGISTNSQNNDDAPPPQDGRCPPRRGAVRYCTFFRHNSVHDNNNPNTPGAGTAELGPVGTGIVIGGGRFNTVQGNRIFGNGAWGVLFVPYPDDETPPPNVHCQGGTPGGSGFRCYFDNWGNRLLSNRFRHNGFFGNPSNGDFGDVSGMHTPGNCAHGNTNPAGFTSDPAGYQRTHGSCGAANTGNPITSTLASQVICATQLLGPCPSQPGFRYPRTTRVVMPRLRRQRTMPHPCAGVPANPWCPAARPRHPHFTG
jgi:hypothetical protein